MRRLFPWLIGIAVAAVAVVATIDAFRSKSESPERAVSTATPAAVEPTAPRLGDADAVDALRRSGATGELVYTDSECRSTRIGLPELASESLGISLGCEPARRGWTVLPRQTSVIVPQACLLVDSPPQGCDAVALGVDDVRTAVGAAGPISIVEIAWLSATRLAAIVRDHDRELDIVAIFERGRLVDRPAVAAAHLAGFGVSPLRRHLAVRSSASGVFVLDWEGRLALPGRFRFPLLETHAVAWSPDDAWTALATRSRLYLLETDPTTRDVIDLPISARTLEWRP